MALDLSCVPPIGSVAGIRSLKCMACDFEFVYVQPEETEYAEWTIVEHVQLVHEGTTVDITVTQH